VRARHVGFTKRPKGTQKKKTTSPAVESFSAALPVTCPSNLGERGVEKKGRDQKHALNQEVRCCLGVADLS